MSANTKSESTQQAQMTLPGSAQPLENNTQLNGTASAMSECMHSKRCNVCKKDHSAKEFSVLPFVGQQPTETEEGAPAVLVMRNCFCGSTLAVEIAL